ncbi:bifunctional enoyl-CoA hydratase/phosphate acetyltransferase [Blastochloris viridis]|uniref:Bifunctional enoyl-CoA hydratase/phosphate acetyltransferase n=1 Tax=Blastochloris viridis TaxID=1079 RepID=A0A0P0IYD8_BLAVI|nr:bifunctional enoyl-CoA hydratase/phosphate acetyltransferase [Blastochloris viridis]CUU41562.1 bifunctional enoyl-CoA hydratase/phosphate acetyltransferase [Blastochloris viridis]
MPEWPDIGDRFEKEFCFSADEISDFATRLGDNNPLHHDTEYAAASRFRGLIACGPHTSALFIALLASWFSPDWELVGLEFQVRFDQPIRVDTTVRMVWTVASVEANAAGTRAKLAVTGEAVDPNGRPLLTGSATLVLWPKEG